MAIEVSMEQVRKAYRKDLAFSRYFVSYATQITCDHWELDKNYLEDETIIKFDYKWLSQKKDNILPFSHYMLWVWKFYEIAEEDHDEAKKINRLFKKLVYCSEVLDQLKK